MRHSAFLYGFRKYNLNFDIVILVTCSVYLFLFQSGTKFAFNIKLNYSHSKIVTGGELVKKRTFITPVLVLLGIVGICSLMATTTLFDPLIHFIHTGEITPIQAVLCLLFTVGGFAAYLYLLNLICSYFVPRIDEKAQTTGANEGGLTQQ